MILWLPYIAAVVALSVGLAIVSYLDRVYRELGRVTTGAVHAHLDNFEAEIEPRLGMDRRRGNLTFSLLAHLWLALVAVVTSLGVSMFAVSPLESLLEQMVYLTLEVVVGMHFVPYLLLTRTSGRWLSSFVPVIRALVLIVTPLRAGYEVAVSLAHLTEAEEPGPQQAQQEGIEQLVEAAEEEGILAREQAHLIEQVVEFTDKRVRDVMTPRPDIVAIPAQATVEQLRRLLVETKFSRIPVYTAQLDDIAGIVYARDVLHVAERDAARRTVSELIRPALFVPETKLGSQLLKELQQKNQQMAVAIDEYGNVAGVVTVEDLVEEIVGEIGEEDRAPVPDVVRQSDGSLLLRGSVSLEKVAELFDVEMKDKEGAPATTIAGLLSHLAGHVPVPGETIDHDSMRFEVVEANQRKVLRLRARRAPEGAALAADTT